MFALPARTVHNLTRHWTRHLASYRRHGHDEHREALIDEALRFASFRLEDALRRTTTWADAPLARRVAVLLLLVDLGLIVRRPRDGRYEYEAVADAEARIGLIPTLAPYLGPVLDLIAAVRGHRTAKDE
jgi:hypothetical protein